MTNDELLKNFITSALVSSHYERCQMQGCMYAGPDARECLYCGTPRVGRVEGQLRVPTGLLHTKEDQ